MKQFHMINPGEKVLLGLSGGADSVCLFFVLLALKEEFSFTLEAVHVNHGMRKTAERDEQFVKELCAKEQVPLHIAHENVVMLAKEWNMSPEETGREVRYRFFEDVAKQIGAAKIAVAHHGNDSAETMLFHLCRGTGIDGLCGIRPVRDSIIRPLLCVGREQIEDYLRVCEKTYMTDETNRDNRYSRNQIRNGILPKLEEVCHGATQHMVRTGEILAMASDYLKEQVEEVAKDRIDVKDHDRGCITLLCEHWEMLHVYMQSELIRRCISLLAGSRKDISKVHVDAVGQLVGLQVGSKCDLPYNIRAEKSYDRIIFQKNPVREEMQADTFCVRLTEEQLSEGICVDLPDGKTVELKVEDFDPKEVIPTKTYTKWLDYDKIEEAVTIRFPQSGDYFYFDNKNRKYVKDYMVNEKIPAADRSRSVLIASGNQMLYFVGRRICYRVKTDETTKRILKITVTGG